MIKACARLSDLSEHAAWVWTPLAHPSGSIREMDPDLSSDHGYAFAPRLAK